MIFDHKNPAEFFKTLDSKTLQDWDEAACIALAIFTTPEVKEKVDFLLSRENVGNVLMKIECLHKIIDERERSDMDLQAAHEIEQGEAREQNDDFDISKTLPCRVARLLKLIQCNAPASIINQAINLVVQAKPTELTETK